MEKMKNKKIVDKAVGKAEGINLKLAAVYVVFVVLFTVFITWLILGGVMTGGTGMAVTGYSIFDVNQNASAGTFVSGFAVLMVIAILGMLVFAVRKVHNN